MKQKFFDEIDSDWGDLISDIYNNTKYFKPEYEFIDGNKYLTNGYTNKDIGDKKELLLDKDLHTIYYNVFINCTNLLGDLIIPDSVEFIKNNSFYNCTGFTSIKLSNNLKEIGFGAFSRCKFTGELVIPDSVEYIYNNAFENCAEFTSLRLSNNLKKIGKNAFCNCFNLTGNLIIPDSVENIGTLAFCNCSKLSGELVIPESVEYIGEYAFHGCNFNRIYVSKKRVDNYISRWSGLNCEFIEY